MQTGRRVNGGLFGLLQFGMTQLIGRLHDCLLLFTFTTQRKWCDRLASISTLVLLDVVTHDLFLFAFVHLARFVITFLALNELGIVQTVYGELATCDLLML